ncbi:MAG: phosphatidylglycerophosphatase A, partial [Sulfuricurvum sp.]|nr:phosphatidylglycerophosphatase A [Sulfuricurvum sp.]
MNLRWFFLTVGYSGLSPKAAGTAGTLVSLPLGVAIF